MGDKEISKNTLLVLVILVLVFSVATTGMIVYDSMEQKEQQNTISKAGAETSGYVEFYVREKLEPQKEEGKVKFEVIKNKEVEKK